MLIGTSNETKQQCEVVQDPMNRVVLDRVKDDSTSLRVLLDDASFRSSVQTRSSTSTSQMSLRFPGLDEALMQHKTYQTTFRSLIRRMGTTKSQNRNLRQAYSKLLTKEHTASLPKAFVVIGGDKVLAHSFTIANTLLLKGMSLVNRISVSL